MRDDYTKEEWWAIRKKVINTRDRFVDVADHIVQYEIAENVSGVPIDEEQREIHKAFIAQDLATGEYLTKKKHLLTGVAIGLGIAGLGVFAHSRFKKRKDA